MMTANRSRVLGRDSAPIKMLVVSDYQCATCRAWFQQTLPVIRSEYIETGRARLTWVHYPLREHPAAVRAASAALCAGVQQKFWEATTRLFAAQTVWGQTRQPNAIIDSLVSVPGTEAFSLRNCIDSQRMMRQVRADIDWADTNRVGTPPLIVIGARRISGATPVVALRAILDSAIAGK
jgi:protein-disulfide isomerase